MSDVRRKPRLFDRNEDEVARIGRPVGIEVDDLAGIVARLHGAATHIDGLGPFDAFQLRRRQDFTVGAVIDQDAFLVARCGRADDGQARAPAPVTR